MLNDLHTSVAPVNLWFYIYSYKYPNWKCSRLEQFIYELIYTKWYSFIWQMQQLVYSAMKLNVSIAIVQHMMPISRCPVWFWSLVYNEMHTHSNRKTIRFTTFNRNLLQNSHCVYVPELTNFELKILNRKTLIEVFIRDPFLFRFHLWVVYRIVGKFEQSNGLFWKWWMQKLDIETLFESEFCSWNYSFRIKYK